MDSKERANNLVDYIHKELGIRISKDDPLLIIMLMQQDLQKLSIETFEKRQVNILEKITNTLKEKQMEKISNWPLYLGVFNTIILVILLAKELTA